MSVVLATTTATVAAVVVAACTLALVLAAASASLARWGRAPAAGLVAPRGARFGDATAAAAPATEGGGDVVRMPARPQGAGHRAA